MSRRAEDQLDPRQQRLCHQQASLVQQYGTRDASLKCPVLRLLCNRSHDGPCSYSGKPDSTLRPEGA
ncbi:hypothetical protein TsFJ059_000362 [Trichoderma semiorbis]|uniref:Uncharacterized protein n=1 Tax=Trichoderma semiorbis TaxID=1491008 RepID=A0A9P8HPR6_9HYPO|nr:hypothetical protein TsFJ059_000362 [Trichoderma semiorbis]